ncbi:MAG: hypothetical protein R3C19_26875 [Planctomycetaceae bacterium]
MLRKNHTDEQFLAQRKLKELPETITRLRLADNLQTDRDTLERHAADPLRIGGRTYHPDDLASVLSDRLKALPGTVSGSRSTNSEPVAA